MYADKLRATDNADEILKASGEYTNEGLNHNRKDSIEQFARGNVLMRIGNNDYTADVIVATKANGRMLLYDIIDMAQTQIEKRYSIAEHPIKVADRKAASLKNSISKENVSVKMSDEKSLDLVYLFVRRTVRKSIDNLML